MFDKLTSVMARRRVEICASQGVLEGFEPVLAAGITTKQVENPSEEQLPLIKRVTPEQLRDLARIHLQEDREERERLYRRR